MTTAQLIASEMAHVRMSLDTEDREQRHPVLGKLTPDPIGVLLKTGFQRFSAPCGVDGLCCVSVNRLEILAVHARQPGRGAFRELLGKAKRHFKVIVIFEVWNERLKEFLLREGFQSETIQRDGEIVEAYRWG